MPLVITDDVGQHVIHDTRTTADVEDEPEVTCSELYREEVPALVTQTTVQNQTVQLCGLELWMIFKPEKTVYNLTTIILFKI